VQNSNRKEAVRTGDIKYSYIFYGENLFEADHLQELWDMRRTFRWILR